MGLNLGAGVQENVSSLRAHEQWQPFLDNFEALVVSKIQESLNASPDQLVGANYYARALNDVWNGLTAMTREVNQRQVAKLGTRERMNLANV